MDHRICPGSVPGVCACKETATAVFRIFQEVLTNITSHAKASRVDVLLEQEAGQFRLTVRDNGCGFAQNEPERRTGFGLLGMRERAEILGGTLEIIAAPNAGTTVKLALPERY